MIKSNNDDFEFTGERPEAWSFSCKRVGQQTPKEVAGYSGIRPQSAPDFVGTRRPDDQSDDDGGTR